jgi:hypothetical protein
MHLTRQYYEAFKIIMIKYGHPQFPYLCKNFFNGLRT